MKKDDLLQLMAFADGELTGEEREAMAKRVDEDPAAAELVSQLGSLGDLFRESHEEGLGAKAASFDAVDAIMARVASEEPDRPSMSPSQPVAKVASLEEARRRRMGVAAGVAAALALAAGFIFLARNPEDRGPSAEVSPVSPVVAPAEAPSEKAAPPVLVASADPVPAGPDVEVHAVESPGHSVSVLYLPNANEVSTSVVVWIDETGEK